MASHFPKKKGGTSPYFTSDTGRGPIFKKGRTSCYTGRNVQTSSHMPENGGASLFTRIKRQDVPSVFERGRFPSSPGKEQYCILLYDYEGWASRSAGEEAELPLVLCLTQRGRPFRCSVSTKGEPYLFLKESCMPWSSEISHCFRKRVGTSSGSGLCFPRKRGAVCLWHVSTAQGESGQPLTMKREIKGPQGRNGPRWDGGAYDSGVIARGALDVGYCQTALAQHPGDANCQGWGRPHLRRGGLRSTLLWPSGQSVLPASPEPGRGERVGTAV